MIEIEPHLTVTEVAKGLHLSYEKVRQMIKDEPGVLIIQPPKTPSISRRRPPVTYRIPQSVLERILRRITNSDVPLLAAKNGRTYVR